MRFKRGKKDSGTNTDFLFYLILYQFHNINVGICCVLCLLTVNGNFSKSAKSDLQQESMHISDSFFQLRVIF